RGAPGTPPWPRSPRRRPRRRAGRRRRDRRRARRAAARRRRRAGRRTAGPQPRARRAPRRPRRSARGPPRGRRRRRRPDRRAGAARRACARAGAAARPRAATRGLRACGGRRARRRLIVAPSAAPSRARAPRCGPPPGRRRIASARRRRRPQPRWCVRAGAARRGAGAAPLLGERLLRLAVRVRVERAQLEDERVRRAELAAQRLEALGIAREPDQLVADLEVAARLAQRAAQPLLELGDVGGVDAKGLGHREPPLCATTAQLLQSGGAYQAWTGRASSPSAAVQAGCPQAQAPAGSVWALSLAASRTPFWQYALQQ